jgi:hypothetical protein
MITAIDDRRQGERRDTTSGKYIDRESFYLYLPLVGA